MLSPVGEQAANNAIGRGKAILKFISPNDVGLTGSHQAGFYLPMALWRLYSPKPPEKGVNFDHPVTIRWQDGRITESCVKWYGSKTRYEFRLTRFGRDFPFLLEDNVGNLLIIVPENTQEFSAYVLDLEDDIEEVQAALGIQVIRTWAAYDVDRQDEPIDENACVEKKFRTFVSVLTEFPSTKVFSDEAWQALEACLRDFVHLSSDDQLMKAMDAEYRLFKMAERYLCGPMVQRMFKSIDDFLQTAGTILNRRKARAGWSLENHVERLLSKANIAFEMRPSLDGRPDVVIPSAAAYRDPNYPEAKLMVLGIKTTCKDRWRQILNEAKRVRHKHLLTIQSGISSAQLAEMRRAQVTLIVPKNLHTLYPEQERRSLLELEQFIRAARRVLR